MRVEIDGIVTGRERDGVCALEGKIFEEFGWKKKIMVCEPERGTWAGGQVLMSQI